MHRPGCLAPPLPYLGQAPPLLYLGQAPPCWPLDTETVATQPRLGPWKRPRSGNQRPGAPLQGGQLLGNPGQVGKPGGWAQPLRLAEVVGEVEKGSLNGGQRAEGAGGSIPGLLEHTGGRDGALVGVETHTHLGGWARISGEHEGPGSETPEVEEWASHPGGPPPAASSPCPPAPGPSLSSVLNELPSVATLRYRGPGVLPWGALEDEDGEGRTQAFAEGAQRELQDPHPSRELPWPMQARRAHR